MADHDDLLSQGPREAPEPETAEQRSSRLGKRGLAGGVVGGGAAAAKLGALGGLTKVFVWLFAWHGIVDAGHVFGWIGVVAVVAGILGVIALRRRHA